MEEGRGSEPAQSDLITKHNKVKYEVQILNGGNNTNNGVFH